MALKRNVIANFAGQGWTAVMGLAFIPLYIHYLGVEAFGLIGLYAVMQALLTILDMGMTPTLNREMARFTAGAHSAQSINDLLRSLETLAIGIAAIIGMMIWLASEYVASGWLKANELPVMVVAQAISIMGWVVALRFVEGIYRGSLFGLQRHVWYNGMNGLIATLRHGGVVVVLAWISPSIQAFFMWQIAISIVAVAVLAAGVHRALPPPAVAPKFSFIAIAGIWKFASGMMALTFLAILLTQADKVLLSRLLPLEAFGYYALAATVAGVLYVVTGPVINAFYPRMVELLTQDDRIGLASLYHQGAQLVTVLTAPAVILLCVFAENVIFVWSGEPGLAENTAPILSVFVLGVFLNCLMHMPAQLQLASGWVSLGIKTNLVAVIILIPALFWVVPRYGVIGAAWIWVVLNAGYVLIAVRVMHRRLCPNEMWRWYIADVALPMTGAAIPVLVAGQFQLASYQSRWGDFMFLSITGVAALVMSAALSDKIRPKMLVFVKHKVQGA